MTRNSSPSTRPSTNPAAIPGSHPQRESAADRDEYRRAVMTIQTPVSVTLARKKFSLERIMDLVPGALLTFDVHCDQPLMLEAGGKVIGTGEAVKIGDKFGLRVRDLYLPQDSPTRDSPTPMS